jgi:hypothetical protein
MTPDAFFGWTFLAGTLFGIGITIEAFVMPAVIVSARQLYLHATKRPHDCKHVILGPRRR